MKKLLLIALVLFLLQGYATAQDVLTLHPLSSIPQASYENPSQMPDCKIHIGCFPVVFVPVFSSMYTHVSNSGFKYDDVVHVRKSNDSLYIDMDDVADGLHKKDHLMINTQFEYLSFGFKMGKKEYINFSFSEKFNTRFTYPRDLIRMAWYGNAPFVGSYLDFTGLGIDVLHYREFAVGYAYEINKRWTAGARLKLLFGLGNIWTRRTNATLSVQEDYYDLIANSDMIVYTSAPQFVYDQITTKGRKLTSSDAKEYLTNFNNPGIALDLGVTWKINDKFTASASVNDLGLIYWTTGTRKFVSSHKSFAFKGFDVTEFMKNDTVRFGDLLTSLVDSLGKVFTIDEKEKNYTTPLNTKIYLSGYYNISPKDKVMVITRTDIYENTIHPNFAVGYTRKFGTILDFSISYAYMNRNWLNLGIGTSVRLGPFQFWLATDNFLAAIIPYHTKSMNVNFGCNIVIYNKPSIPLHRF